MEPALPLEKEMQNLFAKFPPALTDFLVKVMPWLALLGGVFGLLGLLSLAKLEGDYGRYIGAAAYGSTWQYYLSIIGGAIAAVIYLLAFTPLRTNRKRGWDLLFYAFLLSLVLQLATLNFVSLIIGFLLGGWILFQLRPRYT
jgi:hypothetical protein